MKTQITDKLKEEIAKAINTIKNNCVGCVSNEEPTHPTEQECVDCNFKDTDKILAIVKDTSEKGE